MTDLKRIQTAVLSLTLLAEHKDLSQRMVLHAVRAIHQLEAILDGSIPPESRIDAIRVSIAEIRELVLRFRNTRRSINPILGKSAATILSILLPLDPSVADVPAARKDTDEEAGPLRRPAPPSGPGQPQEWPPTKILSADVHAELTEAPETQSSAQAPEMPRTDVLPAHIWEPSGNPAPSATPPVFGITATRALIVRVTDTETGEEADFRFVRWPLRVGRAPECELRLLARPISRHHGSLDLDAERVMYTDLGSTNGSLVGGVPSKPRVAVEVEEGATICVGQIFLRVTIASADPSDHAAGSAMVTFPGRPTGTEYEVPDVKTVVLLSGSCPLARPAAVPRSKLTPIYLGAAAPRGEHPAWIPEAASPLLALEVSPPPEPERVSASLEPEKPDVLSGLERIAAQGLTRADRELLLAARAALESLARDLAEARSCGDDGSDRWRELLDNAVSGWATRLATPPPMVNPPRLHEAPIELTPLNLWPETRILKRSQQQGPRLVALDDAGAPSFLLDKAELTIGRGEDCDIVIAHSSVSRNHARIVSEGVRWTLIDLDSANGIFVDGVRFKSTEIKHGSVVQIGQVRFQVSFLAE